MSWDVVLFDLDGTLTDSGPGVMKAAQYALHAFGVEIADWRTLGYFVGPPLIESFEAFFPAEEAEGAVEKFREYYNAGGWLENSVYPGIPACLRALREAGKRLYVATSKPQAQAERVLAHFALERYFSGISGAPQGDRAGGTKEAVVRRALALAGEEGAGRAVLVGDRKYDVEGGHAAQLPVLGVLYGYGSREELTQAGADGLAAAPEEITELILSYNGKEYAHGRN